jgi:hypothetical protein
MAFKALAPPSTSKEDSRRLYKAHAKAVRDGATILNQYGINSQEFRDASAAATRLRQELRLVPANGTIGLRLPLLARLPLRL